MDLEERKRLVQISRAWRAGEKIDSLQFRYNTQVKAILADGTTVIGWIVGASIDGPEPLYLIETIDDRGDIECPESQISSV